MSIVAGDIKFFGSATMPDDDSEEEIGGAIDETVKIEFTDIDATGGVEVVSSAGGDTTQEITVTGRNAAGEVISDTKQLNGTTPVAITGSFERLLKATLNGSASGTVTLRKASNAGDLMLFEPGVLQVRRIFYSAVADVAGGSERKYHEKIFAKNDHGSLSLLAAQVIEQSDPSGKIAFDLESEHDGTDTNGAGNNRLVAPSGYTFNSDPKNVAEDDLASGEAQGIWLELTLAAGDAAAKTTYGLRVTGQTT